MSFDLKKDPLIDSFLSSLRLEKGLSENTIKAYSNDCQAFSKWLLSTKKHPVLRTTEEDIQSYLKHFQNLNLSHSTINRKLSSLKHSFYYLSKKKILKSCLGRCRDVVKFNNYDSQSLSKTCRTFNIG